MINLIAKPLQKNGPIHRQICDQLRSAILEDRLASGTRIPPAQEMARMFDLSVGTVQAALAPLVKEGLLERRQKIGTFVANGVLGGLGQIGVYFGSDFWSRKEMAFYRDLHRELFSELRSQDSRPLLLMDTRPEIEQTEALPEITDAIKRRQMQGLIVGVPNAIDRHWISQLKIPVSIYGAANLPGQVWTDFRQYFEMGFQELQRQGCRTAAIIFPVPIHVLIDTGEDKAFFSDLPGSAARYGLKLDPESIRIPEVGFAGEEFESFGYNEFKRLWSMPTRPEGLLVFPDVVARGVITSVLESRVDVPKDLKLILHRNEGMSFHAPMPATWVVSSARQIAVTLVEQIRRQINGKGVRPIRIPMAIETF